jgi:hypothetical protein
MGLIINQGTQDTTQDNKFNPIVAQDVLLQITELKLAQTQASTLEVTFRILDGQYKNRFVFDRISFDPKSQFSWKYRQLRKCAGVPYQEGEPANIDIEALLLNKAVKADLGTRKGTNKNGEEQEYQDIKYKILKNTPVTPQPVGSVFSQPITQPEQTTVKKASARKVKQPEETITQVLPENVVEEIVNVNTEVDAPSLVIDDDEDWG